MTYDGEVEQVTYRSDKAEGPTAGSHRGPARVPGPPGHPPPRARPGDAALLWLVRQPDPGHATATGERRGRGAGRDRRAGGLVAPRSPIPLGGAAPPHLRSRSAHLSPGPGADADRRRDHRARRDHPDPRPSSPGPDSAGAEPPSAKAPLPDADRSHSLSPVAPGPTLGDRSRARVSRRSRPAGLGRRGQPFNHPTPPAPARHRPLTPGPRVDDPPEPPPTSGEGEGKFLSLILL
jgi:hypothetical protein